ncbi:hypothetical protein [Myxococcus eversor]|uniref:hypothetical protein n=1 Tax=Myxococcus eversor TaxID=2709661 RepID=UPI0013D13F83|nr:hypothetical protein [Myxococcus eversor]
MTNKTGITNHYILLETATADTGDGFLRGVERWSNPITFDWIEFDLSKPRFRRIVADASSPGPWEGISHD